ncbi:hypothetical protein ACMWQD_28975, partial [Escherichia coli]|uniref:hypothetical protein n=1 Tax=Escherichia coli TaxID=562 RepID=UPI0039DFB396
MRHGRRGVDEWHNAKTRERYQQQGVFAPASGTPRDLFTASSTRVSVADEIPTDRHHHEHELGNIGRHRG